MVERIKRKKGKKRRLTLSESSKKKKKCCFFACKNVSLPIHYKVYEVKVRKSAIKRIEKAPESIQVLFDELIEDLETRGPIQKLWPNFSGLRKGRYHCHLAHSWVACWYCEAKTVEIEVYYAGSREGAPY